jgi:hypothetical protein
VPNLQTGMEMLVLLFDKSKFDRQRKLYDLGEIRIKQEDTEEGEEENGAEFQLFEQLLRVF